MTVTVPDAVAVQPAPLVTVTVYVVVDVGFTEMEAVVAPVFQRYVPPPEAVIVAVWPLQIVALVAAAAGNGLTVTVPVALTEPQPPVKGML